MSIDIHHERLLKLADVPAYLEARGVRVSKRRVYGWVERGLLETVRVGVLRTSQEAIQRMAEGEKEASSPAKDKRHRSAKQVRKEALEAMRRAEEEGW